MAGDLLLAPGERVTPERAGWRYLSFRVQVVATPTMFGGDDHETALVILAGGMTVDGRELPGRPSVWEGLPTAAYLPAGVRVTVAPTGASVEVAVAEAPSTRGGELAIIGPEAVTVEVRGAGNATRQINHIITPAFAADRLEVVEVYTPGGNWSSWPPHKHDTDDMPREAVLEEVYHYRFRRPEAWGVQRVYGPSRDGLWAVHSGDVVLVPDGYHPFTAIHGEDAYYLNALAGDVRTMACSFHPDLAAVMDAWEEMEPDPRVPLVR